MAIRPTPPTTNATTAERIAIRGPTRLRMRESLSRPGLRRGAYQPRRQSEAKAVAEPLLRFSNAQLGYRRADRFGGHRERIHPREQGERALGEEVREVARQPRQVGRDQLGQLCDSRR